jgi:hypothetical protein
MVASHPPASCTNSDAAMSLGFEVKQVTCCCSPRDFLSWNSGLTCWLQDQERSVSAREGGQGFVRPEEDAPEPSPSLFYAYLGSHQSSWPTSREEQMHQSSSCSSQDVTEVSAARNRSRSNSVCVSATTRDQDAEKPHALTNSMAGMHRTSGSKNAPIDAMSQKLLMGQGESDKVEIDYNGIEKGSAYRASKSGCSPPPNSSGNETLYGKQKKDRVALFKASCCFCIVILMTGESSHAL